MKKFLSALFLLCFTSAAFPAENVMVFAAASVGDLMDEIIRVYQSQGGGPVVGSYAASGTLAKQIEALSPAGIFVSADPIWMDRLEKAGLIAEGSRKDYLGNNLVLIAPKGTKPAYDFSGKEKLSSLLSKHEKLAIGDPDYVPAGKYAQEALTRLNQWASLEPALVRADNVRAVLSFVERKAAAMGVVYGSDAAASQNVSVIAVFPGDSYNAIRYPVGIIEKNATEEVRKFYLFLQSSEVRKMIEKHGFTPL